MLRGLPADHRRVRVAADVDWALGAVRTALAQLRVWDTRCSAVCQAPPQQPRWGGCAAEVRSIAAKLSAAADAMEAAAEAAGAALQDATTALLGLESAAALGGQDGEAACAFPAAAVVSGAQGLRLLCRAGEQQAEAAQRLVVHRRRHERQDPSVGTSRRTRPRRVP